MELGTWRNEVLSRLRALRGRARQTRQSMAAQNLQKLDDKKDFKAAWEQIESLFPEGFHPNRSVDLTRHIFFAQQQDFQDIEIFDIPAVIQSVERYGQGGEAFIAEELQRVRFNSSVSDLIHPQIKDACTDLIKCRKYREATRAAVDLFMDELKRLAQVESYGDTLIRDAIGTTSGKLAFSDCCSNNAKKVTEGLKLVAQGLYRGVRNPLSHGWNDDGYEDIECLQIMATCSILLTRLQLVGAPADSAGRCDERD